MIDAPHLQKIVPLQPRRSYLDAAREQGVHQEREELLDENAKLRAKMTRTSASNGEDLPKASVASLVEHSPVAAAFAVSLTEQRERFWTQLRSMVETIGASPLAGPWFPTFALMLLDEDGTWTPETAASYLEACLQQDAKTAAHANNEADEKPRRLNGEGLFSRSNRKDPP